MFRLLLCVAVYICHEFQGIDGTGRITLDFTRYTSVGRPRKDGDSACDKASFLYLPCDVFFEICFDPRGGDTCDLVYSAVFDSFFVVKFDVLPTLSFPVISVQQYKLTLRLLDLDSSNNFERQDNDYLGVLTNANPISSSSAIFIDSTTSNSLHEIAFTIRADCDLNFYGPDCSVFCAASDDDTGGHFSCSAEGVIECLPGYTNPLTNPGCITGIDLCSPVNPCQNGGSCIQNAGETTFSCDCAGTGFSGDLCDVDIDECASSPCLNGGTCIEGQPTMFHCLCGPYIEGLRCETAGVLCFIPANRCMNGGSCSIVSLTTTTCVCPPGFQGDHCEFDIDECAENPCHNGGICTQLIPPNFMCSCLRETTGSRCEEFVDPCRENPCKHGGTCILGRFGRFECACIEGVSGDTCGEPGNACLSGPCINGGRCTDTIGGFKCCCPDGFTGDNCQFAMQTINLVQFLQGFNFLQLSLFRSAIVARCPDLTFTSFYDIVIKTTRDSNCFYSAFYDKAREAGHDVGRVGPKGLISPVNATRV